MRFDLPRFYNRKKNMKNIVQVCYALAVAAASALLFSYGLEESFLKIYAIIGAIWLATLLLPRKFLR
jgi:hypothetical protein